MRQSIKVLKYAINRQFTLQMSYLDQIHNPCQGIIAIHASALSLHQDLILLVRPVIDGVLWPSLAHCPAMLTCQ